MASWVNARFTEMPPDWLSCPLGVYSVLAGVIVSRFDSALWGFRGPVRKIEKVESYIPFFSSPLDYSPV